MIIPAIKQAVYSKPHQIRFESRRETEDQWLDRVEAEEERRFSEQASAEEKYEAEWDSPPPPCKWTNFWNNVFK